MCAVASFSFSHPRAFVFLLRSLTCASSRLSLARAPQPKPLIKAVGITLLSGAICSTLAQAFFPLIARILRFVTQEFLIGAGAAFGFGVAATLFKVQDDY